MTEVASTSDKLLIVEDDEGLRRQYRWIFPELQLSTAGTREEAIAAVRRHAISAAIVDLGFRDVISSHSVVKFRQQQAEGGKPDPSIHEPLGTMLQSGKVFLAHH